MTCQRLVKSFGFILILIMCYGFKLPWDPLRWQENETMLNSAASPLMRFPLYEDLIVDLYINAQFIEATPCIIEQSKQIWLPQAIFDKITLPKLSSALRYFRNQPYYSLAMTNIDYQIDYQYLKLIINMPSENLARNQVGIPDTYRLPFLRPQKPGTFFNYDIYLHKHRHAKSTHNALLGEIGHFNRFGVGTTDFLWRSHQEFYYDKPSKKNNELVRLETTWTLDQPEKVTTWRFGDSVTSAPIWGAQTQFAGIQYTSNFSTQPYLIKFPLPTISGQNNLPSIVNIFVNNNLSLSRSINSGPFDIYNLPVITGKGEVRILTQDLLGKEKIFSIPYYASEQLLKPDLEEFSYQSGFVRHRFGLKSFDYRKWFASGTYRRGINNQWTLGGHVEGLMHQQTVGISSDYLLKDYFVLSMALATSKTEGEWGGLGSIGINRRTPRWIVGGRLINNTSDFKQLGFKYKNRSPQLTLQSYITYISANMGTFGASYLNISKHDRAQVIDPAYIETLPAVKLLTLTYSKTLFKNLYLIVNGIKDFKHHRNNIAFMSLVWGFDNGHSVSISANAQKKYNQQTLTLTKNLPWGNGVGYSLKGAKGDQEYIEAYGVAQHEYGQYAARAMQGSQQQYYWATASGAIVNFDNKTLFTRSLYDGFALVEAPNLPYQNIFARNNVIGKTNRRGLLVVPNLLAYQSNKIAVDPLELDITTSLPEHEYKVMPYYRSGIIVPFNAQRVLNLQGYFKNNKSLIPPGASITLKNHATVHYVGEKGRFFIPVSYNDNIQGIVNWGDEACHFKIQIPTTTKPMLDVGNIKCH